MHNQPRDQWRDVHLPDHAVGKVFCPTCGVPMQGYKIKNNAFGEFKYVLPCEHRMFPEQEQYIVNDILRKGL